MKNITFIVGLFSLTVGGLSGYWLSPASVVDTLTVHVNTATGALTLTDARGHTVEVETAFSLLVSAGRRPSRWVEVTSLSSGTTTSLDEGASFLKSICRMERYITAEKAPTLGSVANDYLLAYAERKAGLKSVLVAESRFIDMATGLNTNGGAPIVDNPPPETPAPR